MKSKRLFYQVFLLFGVLSCSLGYWLTSQRIVFSTHGLGREVKNIKCFAVSMLAISHRL